WSLGKSLEREQKQHLSNQEDIKSIVYSINEKLDADDKASVPLISLYSTNRAVVSVPLRVRKQHKFDQIAALESSLLGKREESDFKLFFEWFRNREDVENELFRTAQREGQHYDGDPQLNAVRAAIHAMMPGFSSPQVKRQPSLHMVIKKGDEKFKIQDLSDGEKCLLALVGDMARRIAMANPSAPNPLEAEAVFLIDEIELHLHPAWQRMVVPRLLEVFPNAQFFVTTHSPQVLGEVKDTGSIWFMKPGEPIARKKYSLQELLAQCDASAPLSEEDATWTASPARGGELI
ncbi:MAG: AAA family ATPase, partial [Desulfovibrionaceae bacterium]|nr:AAA family ATPase [Desulfovibrionaceae bacterium]